MRRTILSLCLVSVACASTAPAEPSVAISPPTAAPDPASSADAASSHAAQAWTIEGLAQGASALPNLYAPEFPFHREVSTKNAEAQQFFDQGLALAYGFNHDEAARSFARGAALDSSCAMCWWGVALTLGPNYNIPMLPERAQAAWQALQNAQTHAAGATPVEQALIAALAKRYKGPEYVDPVAMQAFNVAYANAMRDVAKRFPDDVDVQTLFAEAAMNVNPWKLWTAAGEPAEGTEEIVATLEGVLRRAPEHVGANHFYIHAVEASKTPGRAVPSADRLGKLLPGAGHVVHMPAHIYQRVGRYADASASNRKAVEVDEAYLAAIEPPGYYGIYVGHNYGFLAYSSSMEGRKAEALAAARKSAERTPKDLVCGMPGMDFFWSEPLLVMVRFGMWNELLAEPRPDAKYSALTALWLHAHGMALVSTGDVEGAKKDLQALRKIGAEVDEALMTGLNQAKLVLDVAADVLEARIADKTGDAQAIAVWQRAVELEDRLSYNEPADWFYPVRHYLGAALLDAGRIKEAERVYRDDLVRNPGNGWSLYGLWKALELQKQDKDARKAKRQFEKAWARADIELTRTAF